MNRAQRVLRIYELSTGKVTGAVVDPKLVFTAALKADVSNIIVSYNHSTGNLKPSRADKELKKKIVTGGKYLHIKVIVHIIVTSEGYYSFADERLL
jgi:DNA repair protein RadC